MQAGTGFNEHRVSHHVLQKQNSQQSQQHVISIETTQPRGRSAMVKIRLQEEEIGYTDKQYVVAGT